MQINKVHHVSTISRVANEIGVNGTGLVISQMRWNQKTA